MGIEPECLEVGHHLRDDRDSAIGLPEKLPLASGKKPSMKPM
jgi:hypothetical protein